MMAKVTMESLQNWFFWTWKVRPLAMVATSFPELNQQLRNIPQIGVSPKLGYDSSPFWHYKRGLEQGWIPTDPRTAAGSCASIGGGGNKFAGTFPASATGGVRGRGVGADLCVPMLKLC